MNDLSLFREVDIPVLLGAAATPALSRLVHRISAARLTDRRGPTAWAEAVHAIVSQLVPVAGGGFRLSC
jgi:hypothetical protein